MSILSNRCTRERERGEYEGSQFAALSTIIISSDLTRQRLIFHIPETKTSHRISDDAGAFNSIKFAARLAELEETRLGYHMYYTLLHALVVKCYGSPPFFSLAIGKNGFCGYCIFLKIADSPAETCDRGLFRNEKIMRRVKASQGISTCRGFFFPN